jgi:hypothetical protein
MKIDKLIEYMDLEELSIYKSEIFKPFIDCFIKSRKPSKYKLFNAYIFQYNKLVSFYKERDYIDNSYFLKNGNLNLKLKKVRDSFINNNVVYFIGYTYALNAFFIRMDYFKDKINQNGVYHFSGFMQESCNDKYDYLTSDPKKLNFKLKNVDHAMINLTEYDYSKSGWIETPIVTLSKLTKNYVNSLN